MAFKSVLKQEGIYFKYSCPHTHHQNGIVKRKHWHIIEIGLTLLAQSHLPFLFGGKHFIQPLTQSIKCQH